MQKNELRVNFYTPVLNTKQKQWDNSRLITTLSDPSQITSVGVWRIANVSATVNDSLDDDSLAFDDYSTGDFHVLVFDFNGNETDGCAYGMLLFSSPRWQGKFWMARIWDGKFTGWYKYTGIQIVT